MLLPERVKSYRSALDDSYATYGKVATVVDKLNQELKFQHSWLNTDVKKDSYKSS